MQHEWGEQKRFLNFHCDCGRHCNICIMIAECILFLSNEAGSVDTLLGSIDAACHPQTQCWYTGQVTPEPHQPELFLAPWILLVLEGAACTILCDPALGVLAEPFLPRLFCFCRWCCVCCPRVTRRPLSISCCRGAANSPLHGCSYWVAGCSSASILSHMLCKVQCVWCPSCWIPLPRRRPF